MTIEELRVEVSRLSPEDKQRFMEEIGLPLCKELMSNPAFMQKMFPRCGEMMGNMPVEFRQRMQEMMGAPSFRR